MIREEIISRRLSGQHLLSPVSAKTAAADLCGIQAQFISHALHALKIRGAADTEGLIKSWTNRGTMHIFPERDLPLFLHKGRTHFLRPVDTMESDAFVSDERKAYFADIILEAIASGIDEREALKKCCYNRDMSEAESRSLFDPWGGLIRALCEEGRICHNVSEKKSYRLCPEFEPMERDAARTELLRRYFSNFGPATVKDAASFFALPQREIKALMPSLPLSKCSFDGRDYFYMGEDRGEGHIPDFIFLAGFDQFLLGYEKKESLILPRENLREVYTMAGIVRPVLLFRGEAAAVWSLKRNKLEIKLFREQDKSPIESAAHELWADLKEIKFT